jgi:hypothetical protein
VVKRKVTCNFTVMLLTQILSAIRPNYSGHNQISQESNLTYAVDESDLVK